MPLTKIQSLGITDGTIVNADINASAAIDGTKLTGAGIAMAQQWRLSASLTGAQAPISTNLEIVDTDGYGGIGSNMTQSSGVFTFPSTGIYLIKYNKLSTLSGNDRLTEGQIQTTTDGTNFGTASKSFSYINQTSAATTYASGYCEFIFDVTNVTTHKVRFNVDPVNASTSTDGNTNENSTTFTFIRLGDT